METLLDHIQSEIEKFYTYTGKQPDCVVLGIGPMYRLYDEVEVDLMTDASTVRTIFGCEIFVNGSINSVRAGERHHDLIGESINSIFIPYTGEFFYVKRPGVAFAKYLRKDLRV